MDSISIRITNPGGMPLPFHRGIAKCGTVAVISEANGENVKHYRRVHRIFGTIVGEETPANHESIGGDKLPVNPDYLPNGLPRNWRKQMGLPEPEAEVVEARKSPLDRMADLAKKALKKK